MGTTDQLFGGYLAYTDTQEFGAAAAASAPGATSILSFIGYSSYACGGGVSFLVSSGVGASVRYGC